MGPVPKKILDIRSLLWYNRCMTNHKPLYPIGSLLNGRIVRDFRTDREEPPQGQNVGGGKRRRYRYRRFYLLECLSCQEQDWVRMNGHTRKTNGCPCQRRKNFCNGCKKYLPHGMGPSGRCKNCWVRPRWTLDGWLERGRLYSEFRSANSKTRKGAAKRRQRTDAVRAFLYAEQEGLCKLCSMPLDIIGSHLDHCHTTEKVRGLVHPLCNHLVGVLDAAIVNGALLPSIHQIVEGFFSYVGIKANLR